MGKLGEFEEEEFTILRPEPPSPEGGDGPDGEDPEDQPEGNPETLTEEEIDNIIEDAKSNGFDGIDEDGVIDEDDDLTPEPDEDEEEEKGGEDGEEEEKGGEDGEEEEKGGEEDEQRRLKVRYAQLMSKMQNSQKSLADMVNKYGKKIPERIKNGMSETAENMQGLKEITVYED